jgi:hypothetical protein
MRNKKVSLSLKVKEEEEVKKTVKQMKGERWKRMGKSLWEREMMGKSLWERLEANLARVSQRRLPEERRGKRRCKWTERGKFKVI